MVFWTVGDAGITLYCERIRPPPVYTKKSVVVKQFQYTQEATMIRSVMLIQGVPLHFHNSYKPTKMTPVTHFLLATAQSFILSLFFLTVASQTLFAQGVQVIAPVKPDQMVVYLAEGDTKKLIEGADGKPALRIDVAQKGENPWSTMSLSATNSHPIKKGDRLAFSIRMRVTGDQPDVGDVSMHVESTVEQKEFQQGSRLQPTTQLRTYRRAAVCDEDFEAGELQLSIHFAAAAQTLEFHWASLEAFPEGTPDEQLNADAITWEGKEETATWRTEADARIDKLRKRNLEISVLDPKGQPVPNASVSVKQKRHQWRFGTFVSRKLLEDSPDAKRFEKEILQRYNFVTLPAYLANWGWCDEAIRTQYFRMADWAQKNELPARGHLLVYPGWTVTPEEWFTMEKPELRKKLEAHIPEATAAFAARGVTEWDVANELRFNLQFMNEIGGVKVAADWFKMARAHNPNGKLYLNETVILPNGGDTETEQKVLEDQFKLLVDEGAPIDGIGLQGHFGDNFTSPTRMLEILDRISKLDREIMITEFDMSNQDKRAQGDFVRDFYTVCFSHPNVNGIVQWGFWEGDMWKPSGHFLTKDWQETPASKVYNDLVFDKWWTQESKLTDAQGRSTVRAFQGIQTVTIRHKDYRWTKDIVLGDENQEVQVVVP